jgi:hypothetical protein
LTNQQRVWRALGKRRIGSTAVIIGEADEFIDTAWYEKNGLPLLGGQDHAIWKVLPGGHDFVVTAPELIMREIDKTTTHCASEALGSRRQGVHVYRFVPSIDIVSMKQPKFSHPY